MLSVQASDEKFFQKKFPEKIEFKDSISIFELGQILIPSK